MLKNNLIINSSQISVLVVRVVWLCLNSLLLRNEQTLPLSQQTLQQQISPQVHPVVQLRVRLYVLLPVLQLYRFETLLHEVALRCALYVRIQLVVLPVHVLQRDFVVQ